jgi:hypothetical protein
MEWYAQGDPEKLADIDRIRRLLTESGAWAGWRYQAEEGEPDPEAPKDPAVICDVNRVNKRRKKQVNP